MESFRRWCSQNSQIVKVSMGNVSKAAGPSVIWFGHIAPRDQRYKASGVVRLVRVAFSRTLKRPLRCLTQSNRRDNKCQEQTWAMKER